MIPAGPSKWTGAFQSRQFDTQVESTCLNPWVSQTDGWIANPTSAGAGDVGNAAGDTAGDGTVLDYLANPPAGGITASATPAVVFSENANPPWGALGYPYNGSVPPQS